MAANMAKILSDTKTNLLMGLRLAFFRKCDAGQFIINTDQLVVLLMLDILLNILFGFFLALPKPEFDVYALPVHSLNQLVTFLLAYILAKLWKKPEIFLTLSVMLLSLTPVFSALIYWERYLKLDIDAPGSYYQWLAAIIGLYSGVILCKLFFVASERLKAFTAIALASFLIAGVLEFKYYGDYQDFWHLAEDKAEQEIDPWSEYRAMDAEKLLYSQPGLLASALETLKPQRENRIDLFFVGFAGYAPENVFAKEVVYAKNFLDARFDSEGHSINLINHLATRETQPLADITNLAATLKTIGSMMNKEEDVLLMYLTSHGSEDHKLAVSFWPLPLNDLTPEKLRAILDEAGIKWRVIIISACYSGGFVNALKNDNTLVATAAAEDKTSFGCGTESEFTYFGEALFKGSLPYETSFVSALQQARIAIDTREKRENIEASFPQLSIGKSIQAKLESLGAEIKLRQCETGAGKASC